MIWTFRKILYRAYHRMMRLVIRVLAFPEPQIVSGPESERELPALMALEKCRSVLVVTDKTLVQLGLLSNLLSSLQEQGIQYAVYDSVPPNPAIPDVENGLLVFLENRCDSVIGFGGGSPMDCAKIVAARAANPGQPVHKMRGLFKVKRRPVPLYAVPTTAGTGSETTVAAIITDGDTHEKFAVSDLKLVPRVAVFNPDLTLNLPPHITSTTGMDALTHAVEAYIGLHDIPSVKRNSEEAVRLVLENLEDVYRDGSNRAGREKMLRASYCGGAAFTKASVGYVHAIAHNLGGLYGVPHGLANAIVLPYILDFSREYCEKKLARLARAGGLGSAGDTDETLSRKFIDKVREMNAAMGIPRKVSEIQPGDIPLIAGRALSEANPWYPVPRIMNKAQCEDLIEGLCS